MRHRPGERDVFDLPGDGVSLEDPHPDGKLALPLLVPQDHHGHVGCGIDDQPLDGHFNVHACPQTLCGPDRSTLTGMIRPIHSDGPGRLTTTLVLVRPKTSVSRRRLAPSIRTSTSRPTSPR